MNFISSQCKTSHVLDLQQSFISSLVLGLIAERKNLSFSPFGLGMMMLEAFNSQPACSTSVNVHSLHNHSHYFATRWCIRPSSQWFSSRGCCVVAFANGSRTSSPTAKQRIPESVPLCRPSKSKEESRIALKNPSIEFDSISEEENNPVVEEAKEVATENFPQPKLPPWGSLPEQDSEDQAHVEDQDHLNIPEKPVYEIGNEIYYLEERNEEVLSTRILKLSRSNKVRSALALYRSMVLSDLQPDSHSCNSLLSCLVRNGRLNEALKVFDFMKSHEIMTGHTYSLILKAVANLQSCDAALCMFEEAELNHNTKKYMDIIVYNTMIAIFAKVNNWAQAQRMWRTMKDNGYVGTVVTYRLLVCLFVRCGKNELALDAYHEMVQNALSPSDDAMEAIIGACSREGKWEIALNILQDMLDKELKPSLVACNALINVLGKAAKVDLTFKVYDLIKSLGYIPDAYTWNALLGALNRANRHADVLLLFDSIRKQHKSVLNLHIYNACLVSCKKLGLWEKAMQLLWDIEASGIQASVTSYNLAIGACEVGKNPTVALQVYDHMVQQQLSPDLFTMLSLIRVCIGGCLWDEVEDILNSSPNGPLYNAAIQGMILGSKHDLARKLYMKMHDIGLKPDGKTRALLLDNPEIQNDEETSFINSCK